MYGLVSTQGGSQGLPQSSAAHEGYARPPGGPAAQPAPVSANDEPECASLTAIRPCSSMRVRFGLQPHKSLELIRFDRGMAPQVGLEPTTLRLTVECSAIELLRNMLAVGRASAAPQ